MNVDKNPEVPTLDDDPCSELGSEGDMVVRDRKGEDV